MELCPQCFLSSLQYLLVQKCDHCGSFLGSKMEPRCILVHSVGEKGVWVAFFAFRYNTFAQNALPTSPPHTLCFKVTKSPRKL